MKILIYLDGKADDILMKSYECVHIWFDTKQKKLIK